MNKKFFLVFVFLFLTACLLQPVLAQYSVSSGGGGGTSGSTNVPPPSGGGGSEGSANPNNSNPPAGGSYLGGDCYGLGSCGSDYSIPQFNLSNLGSNCNDAGLCRSYNLLGWDANGNPIIQDTWYTVSPGETNPPPTSGTPGSDSGPIGSSPNVAPVSYGCSISANPGSVKYGETTHLTISSNAPVTSWGWTDNCSGSFSGSGASVYFTAPAYRGTVVFDDQHAQPVKRKT
jgi:hypothetical protein